MALADPRRDIFGIENDLRELALKMKRNGLPEETMVDLIDEQLRQWEERRARQMGRPPVKVKFDLRDGRIIEDNRGRLGRDISRMSYEEARRRLEGPGFFDDAFKPKETKKEKVTYVTKYNDSEMEQAKEVIEQQNKLLENIRKEALLLQTIERMSKCKNFCYVKKMDTEVRIEACDGLEEGHEVLLHPKTFQIVEHLGEPPLEVSPYAPANIPRIKWNDIGGLDEAKQDMVEVIELPHKYKKLHSFYNKKPLKGILLSGPPGCGKTMLGKAAANALADIHKEKASRTGFLYIKGPELLNMYVGATEQGIRRLFRDANRHHREFGYPAIIFLDEADALLATRGNSIGIINTVVPQFLTEMDGLETSTAVVILATNRPDILDPAIVREGRIDRKIIIPRPDYEQTKLIAALNFKGKPTNETKEKASEYLADKLYMENPAVNDNVNARDIINGAMIATCVDISASIALHRDIEVKAKKGTGISNDDIDLAVHKVISQNGNLQHGLEM